MADRAAARRRGGNADRSVADADRSVADADRSVADADRSVADADRSVADADRSVADADRSVADADRAGGDADPAGGDADRVGGSSSTAHGGRRLHLEGPKGLVLAPPLAQADLGMERRPGGDGADRDAAAVVSREDFLLLAKKFVRSYYATLNDEVKTIHKFYDDEAILVWAPKKEVFSSEVKTKKDILEFLTKMSVECIPHCFTAQEKSDVIMLVSNGICNGLGLNRGNYIQSFLLTKDWIIVSDVLYGFENGAPIEMMKHEDQHDLPQVQAVMTGAPIEMPNHEVQHDLLQVQGAPIAILKDEDQQDLPLVKEKRSLIIRFKWRPKVPVIEETPVATPKDEVTTVLPPVQGSSEDIDSNLMRRRSTRISGQSNKLAVNSEAKDSNVTRRQCARVFEQDSLTAIKEAQPKLTITEETCRSTKCTDGKSVAIVYDDRMMLHRPDFYMIQEEDRPKCDDIPERLSSIMDKLYADNLMSRATLVEPGFATPDAIAAVHGADYLGFIDCLPPTQADLDKFVGHYTKDMFCSDGTRDAIFLAAGAAIKASELVYKGEYETAFAVGRPPGHHAARDEAEGYCFTNNLAIAAENLFRKHGAKKIAGVDWDVHHGNGTQELFYSSDQFLFFSTFNKLLTYPTTAKQEVWHVGKDQGAGYNVNVPLRHKFGDVDMLYVFDEVIIPLIKEFSPEIILVSSGFDAATDDVGGCNVSPECFAVLLDKLIKAGNGKVVLVLEGGYKLPVLADCAAKCVGVMTGQSEALLKEGKKQGKEEGKRRPPPKSTLATVKLLKHYLSKYWEVFKG